MPSHMKDDDNMVGAATAECASVAVFGMKSKQKQNGRLHRQRQPHLHRVALMIAGVGVDLGWYRC